MAFMFFPHIGEVVKSTRQLCLLLGGHFSPLLHSGTNYPDNSVNTTNNECLFL